MARKVQGTYRGKASTPRISWSDLRMRSHKIMRGCGQGFREMAQPLRKPLVANSDLPRNIWPQGSPWFSGECLKRLVCYPHSAQDKLSARWLCNISFHREISKENLANKEQNDSRSGFLMHFIVRWGSLVKN